MRNIVWISWCKKSVLAAGPLFAAMMLMFSAQTRADDHKVSICHKGKEISVAEPALDAHFEHGDSVAGPCGCDFDGTEVLLCGAQKVLCVPSDCSSVGCVSCCPPCVCPPDNPDCGCGDPSGPECEGAACSCNSDCGCFEVEIE